MSCFSSFYKRFYTFLGHLAFFNVSWTTFDEGKVSKAGFGLLFLEGGVGVGGCGYSAPDFR
jgi:hypothetical protein